MNDALQGAHVLITRPAHQAENLCRLVEQQGGMAVRFPTLEIVGLDKQIPATISLANLSNRHWLIFTSANAVNFALKANSGKIAGFKAAQIAAIGKATARELELAGLSVDLTPNCGFHSEALLAMPQMQQVDGVAILIVKGQGGREELANVLSSRGARVDYWEVYQRVMPICDTSPVLSLLVQDKLDAVVITSCEALQNLLVMIGERHQQHLALIPLVVISERIGQFAAEKGFLRIAVTENPSDSAILDRVIAIINKSSTKRGIECRN